jgi:Tfp pilus assembly protein PilV
MAMAIPIAMFSMIILAYGISDSQSYYLAYARSAYLQIKYYSVSQQMLDFLNSANENNSAYLESVQNLGEFYNVSTAILNLSDYADCANSFCRIVQVGGTAKILVIK